MSTRGLGRVAVVTGGAAGIGQAVARRLARDGHRVAVADLSPAQDTERLVLEAGAEAFSMQCDVASAADVARFAARVRERFGKVDVLVANAGIYPIKPFAETTWEEWRRVLSVNLDSLFHLLQAFLPPMREARWGRVVALASNLVHTGAPGMVPYVASKSGVVGVVRALAEEIGADGVTINAVAPSLTRTAGTLSGPHRALGLFELVRERQAIKRTETPEDVAGAVSFLASDDAAFITGQTLPVDGGSVRA